MRSAEIETEREREAESARGEAYEGEQERNKVDNGERATGTRLLVLRATSSRASERVSTMKSSRVSGERRRGRRSGARIKAREEPDPGYRCSIVRWRSRCIRASTPSRAPHPRQVRLFRLPSRRLHTPVRLPSKFKPSKFSRFLLEFLTIFRKKKKKQKPLAKFVGAIITPRTRVYSFEIQAGREEETKGMETRFEKNNREHRDEGTRERRRIHATGTRVLLSA